MAGWRIVRPARKADDHSEADLVGRPMPKIIAFVEAGAGAQSGRTEKSLDL
jgi:hypothetical protein